MNLAMACRAMMLFQIHSVDPDCDGNSLLQRRCVQEALTEETLQPRCLRLFSYRNSQWRRCHVQELPDLAEH